jgi:hypothetical protein
MTPHQDIARSSRFVPVPPENKQHSKAADHQSKNEGNGNARLHARIV